MPSTLLVLASLATLAAAPPPSAAAPAPETKEISITSKSPQAVESFKKARELWENGRNDESMAELQKAISLDADFALAHALLGYQMTGGPGAKETEIGAAKSAALPEPERLQIEVYRAIKHGEPGKSLEAGRKLTTLVPGDWRTHFALADAAFQCGKWDDVIAAAKTATELNPKAGAAFNELGGGYLNTRQLDQAIEAFKKYAELAPTEYTAQDSLGEVLLMSNKLDESEAAFKKATELNLKAFSSWAAIGQVRALRGDWKGSHEALAKAKELASTPDDKANIVDNLAFVQFAEGKTDEALKTLEAMDKEGRAAKAVYSCSNSALDRAFVSIVTEKNKEALTFAINALAMVDKEPFSPWGALGVKITALGYRAVGEARSGKKADAQRILELLDETVKKVPENTWYQSFPHFAKGEVLMAAGDAKAAAAEFNQCRIDDHYCHYREGQALAKAGDKTGADAINKKLLTAPMRDPLYAYVWAKLGGIPKAPAKK